jgi:transcriptional pleiotropic regulator of transition state genes
MAYEVVRVTSKGQMTIPGRIRRVLGISEGDVLLVTVAGNEIRLRKMEPFRPLEENDPIWQLIGIGESGYSDVLEKHDRYLADGEMERWRK